MNASGDKRYRRCRGLSDSFGKEKEESVGALIEAFVTFVAEIDEGELKNWEDSRPEKKEDDD